MGVRLAGKVALVTGGGSGLGRATAVLFAEEGAAVGAFDIDAAGAQETARLIESAGGKALALTGDVTLEDDVKRAVERTAASLGNIDVLAACAGIEGPMGQITDTDVDSWDRVMAVNVKGVFLSAKHVIPGMKRGGGGTIVIIASDSSFVAGEGMAPYCASKGAVLMLTKALAVDHAADGIRVNCVCPSIADTPMVRREVGAGPDDDLSNFGLAGLDINSPEDVARHMLFLASDESANMNGAAQIVDFGSLARSTLPI
jgi:dihydroanticapsin dehydrogenase